VQPITDIRYDVIDPPIPIIEIKLFNVTYVSIHRVDPGPFEAFRTP
jgi:hypothetical protein